MNKRQDRHHACSIMAAAVVATGCTGQLPNSFRYAQQEQAFNSTKDVNTKIDLLFVVDNSASMDVSQNNLRRGFSSFAAKYMKPTWDIRVAVITTDTYLANPFFRDATGRNGYLDRVIGGTTLSGGTYYESTWVKSRVATWTNPSWYKVGGAAASMVYTSGANTGAFNGAGLRYRDIVPAWFAYDQLGTADASVTYARLKAGLHDGPIAGLCAEDVPTRHFMAGKAQCKTRDISTSDRTETPCLTATAAYETVVSNDPTNTAAIDAAASDAYAKCVNTIQNDTVRSGQAIIETLGGNTTTLSNAFKLNVTTGSAGHGSERGLGSVIELIDQNEVPSTDSRLFRAGSLRGIIFVSDEDDQTMTLPSTGDSDYLNFRINSQYGCDKAQILSLNGGNAASVSSGGLCCEVGCTYTYDSAVNSGIGCPSKTYEDATTRNVSVCPIASKLVSVSSIKTQLDSFFAGLDGGGSAAPNYFVAAIVPQTKTSLTAMEPARNAEDNAAGVWKTYAVDRGDRYNELVDLVGNGSLKLDISATDYNPVLDAIGQAIIAKKSSFALDREPTGSEDMMVWIVHQDGSRTVIPSTKYTISGKTLTITDYDLVLGFASTDRILINYQPRTAS